MGKIQAEAVYTGSDSKVPEIFVFMRPFFDLSPLPRTLYISALFVAESTRGKGIGKKLIKELCRRAKDSDRNGLSLHCWVENHPAMEFYKRLHFQVKEILDLGPHSKIPYDGRLALLISNNL